MERIAVIGSGIAGLPAARELARGGHRVTKREDHAMMARFDGS